MKTKKEALKSIISNETTNTVERNKGRIQNRARLRESQQIAIKVLSKLDELDWSQKRLAQEMEVSPQQITKIVKGTENLTLETQIKLQEILNIPILATYYERNIEIMKAAIKFEDSIEYKIPRYDEALDNNNTLQVYNEQYSEYNYLYKNVS